jgi:FkbM family methyltransferase
MRRGYYDLRREARRLGWGWVLGYYLRKRFGIREVKFYPSGLSNPVYCRIEGSDIYEYKQWLGDWAESMCLGFAPRTIVDAGANVGYASLRFAREFPDSKILAIEPARQNQAQLRKHCSAYPNISVECSAVWPRSGRVRIRSMNVAHNAYEMVEDPEGDVAALGMTDLMSKHEIDRIDLLKIDIEGSEKLLFDDPRAREWLPRIGMLLIETHDRIVPGCSESLLRAIHGLGAFQGHFNEYEYYLFTQPAVGTLERVG